MRNKSVEHPSPVRDMESVQDTGLRRKKQKDTTGVLVCIEIQHQI